MTISSNTRSPLMVYSYARSASSAVPTILVDWDTVEGSLSLGRFAVQTTDFSWFFFKMSICFFSILANSFPRLARKACIILRKMLARRRTNMEAHDWTTARAIQHKLINCISTAPSDRLLPVLSLSCVRERAYNEQIAPIRFILCIFDRLVDLLLVWGYEQSVNHLGVCQQIPPKSCSNCLIWCASAI